MENEANSSSDEGIYELFDDIREATNQAEKKKQEKERQHSELLRRRDIWLLALEAFRDAAKEYDVSWWERQNGDSEKRHAEAIIALATVMQEIGLKENAFGYRDRIAEMLRIDPSCRMYSDNVGDSDTRIAYFVDELRMCQLFCVGIETQSVDSVLQASLKLGHRQLPTLRLFDNWAQGVWHFELLQDVMLNWKPLTPHQVRVAIGEIRDLSRKAKIDLPGVVKSIKIEGGIRTKILQWMNWFHKYQRENPLQQSLKSLCGYFGQIIGGKVSDPKAVSDGLSLWSHELEFPLLRFVDPSRSEELGNFLTQVDQIYSQDSGNDILTYFRIARCELANWETCVKVDKDTGFTGHQDGWVESYNRHTRSTDQIRRTDEVYRKAVAVASMGPDAPVMLPKLEAVEEAHYAFIGSILADSEDKQSPMLRFHDAIEKLRPNAEAKEFNIQPVASPEKTPQSRIKVEPAHEEKTVDRNKTLLRSFLLAHHEYASGNLKFQTATIEEMAKAIGKSKPTATRTLKELFDDGYAEYELICSDYKSLKTKLEIWDTGKAPLNLRTNLDMDQ